MIDVLATSTDDLEFWRHRLKRIEAEDGFLTVLEVQLLKNIENELAARARESEVAKNGTA